MPGCVNPTPVQQWEPSLLSLQGWDSIPSQEDNRVVTAFLPPALPSCWCYVAVQSVQVLGLLSVRSWWIWVLCIYGISLLSLGLFCHGRSSRDPYELSISSGPGEWSILDTVSCLQRRKLADNFCGLSLRDTDFCVYLKWRNEGRKRIILVDFLLQIQISYLCRHLPPNSFQALHFFFLEPFIWLWILRVPLEL